MSDLRLTVFIEYGIPIFICNLGDNQGRRIQISFFMAKGNCIIFAGIGFTDDAAVIAALIATLGANIKRRHKDQADAALERLRED